MTGTKHRKTDLERKYERVRSLGKDGPFQVEVAWPQSGEGVEQTVLVKRLRPGWEISEKTLAEFLRDAQRAALVVHPNLVRVLHAGKDEDGLYLVTEYIQGIRLSALLRRMEQVDQGFSREHVLQIALQGCRALERAHQDQADPLVHGALGPDHVMLTFDGCVRLKDLGLWRLLAAEADARRGGLETYFLAPEQLQGHQPGPRSDLYGLGRLIRYLLERPPAGEGSIEPQLAAVLQRCLQSDPAKRYPDAAALQRDLQSRSTAVPDGPDPGGLGKLLRALFSTRKPPLQPSASARTPGAATEPKAPGGRGRDLLDPAMFWSENDETSGQGEEEPEDEECVDTAIVESKARNGDQASAGSPPPGDSEPPPPTPLLQPMVEPLPGNVAPQPERSPAAAAPVAAPATPPGPPAPQPARRPRPPALSPSRGSAHKPATGITTGRPVRAGSRRASGGSRLWVWLALFVLLAGAGVVVWQIVFVDDTDAVLQETTDESGGSGTSGEQSSDAAGREQLASGQPHDVGATEPDGGQPGSARTTEYVRLRLTSEPSGAVVFIDGEKRGATPTELAEIPAGQPVEVRFEMEGYRSWKNSYTFESSKRPREVHAGLLSDEECKFGAGWVYVSSDPPGATIEIDGKRLPGKTPKVIDTICAEKSHTITLKRTGYKTWHNAFRTSHGQVANISAQLEK